VRPRENPHAIRPGAHAAVLAALLPRDSIWLITMLPLYRSHLGVLLPPEPDFGPAGLFDLRDVRGALVLVVRPGTLAVAWGEVALHLGPFGFVADGTHDLTNQPTLPHWSWTLTRVGMGWAVC
jgi:uncharacterized membrane protein